MEFTNNVMSDARVHQWVQEVVNHKRQGSRTLTEISYNPRRRTRKDVKGSAGEQSNASRRKRARTMEDDISPTKPRRGRPPASQDTGPRDGAGPMTRLKQLQINSTQTSTTAAPVPNPLSFPPPSMASGSRPESPKKKAKYFDQARTPANIDLPYLIGCVPSVQPSTLQKVKAAGLAPKSVLELHTKLQDLPPGVIPHELKAVYHKDADTPRKSRDIPRSSNYLQLSSPYPLAQLDTLKKKIDRFAEEAAWYHRSKVYERMWGYLANRIVGEIEMWPEGEAFRMLNTETCSIEPEEFKPIMPNGNRLENETETVSSKASSKGDSPKTVGRMVDWCLALRLSYQDEQVVDAYLTDLNKNEQSLNQSLSFIHRSALFLDIVIKKTVPDRDPEVQLAIWASGALLKRQHHGWDTSMPMPGIAINGHMWEYYMFFSVKEDVLTMLGPYTLGTTIDIGGIWAIYYRLLVLVRWGTSEWRKWFGTEVLGGHKQEL